MPRLKMLRGPFPGTDFELDKSVITIGRGHTNDIVIQDNEVSRQHCRLVCVLEDYEIHDLDTTNGTFVDGKRVDESGWLLSGQTILELGDSITLEYLPTNTVTEKKPPIPISHDAQNEKIYYLVIEQRSQEDPEIYVLDRVTITIGRGFDNDISLKELGVSRNHLRLVLTDSGYKIEDLNTINGTSINRHRIDSLSSLKHNDLISIGTSVHMWYTDDPDSVIASIAEGRFDHSKPPKVEGETTQSNVPIERDINIQIGHGLQTGDLTTSVFLNYARDDWTVIGRYIYTYLTDNKINTFTQQYLTPDTTDWHNSLNQALAESPCLLAIISEKSIESSSVTRSIRHFIAREKPVLLLQYGKIDKLPMIIRNIPAVRFDPKNPDKTYRVILAELRRIGL